MSYCRWLSLLMSGALWLFAVNCPAQSAVPRTRPAAGLRDKTPALHALVNGRIILAPGEVLERGTIVFKNGVIVAVGADVVPPTGARVWDATGKTIYPGLIDAFSELATSDSQVSATTGYWNPEITPQMRTDLEYQTNTELNAKLRGQGIVARLVAPARGIIKGTSTLVTTADETPAQTVLKEQVALHLKLTTLPPENNDTYPSSPMGALTLVRQALLDAQWYRDAWQVANNQPTLPRPERNQASAALVPFLDGQLPVIIDAANEWYFLRAARLEKEFSLQVMVRGSGEEYQRLDAIKASGCRVVVPLAFPKAPNVSTPETALMVPLERLLHWDIAPENPARLQAAGVPMALTSHGLKEVSDFLPALRKAVARGLAPDDALRALTVTPARWYGVADRVGTLHVGKCANLLITSGDLFVEQTRVLETWIDGHRFENESLPVVEPRGTWQLTITLPDGGSESLTMTLQGEIKNLTATIKRLDQSVTATRAVVDANYLNINFPATLWEPESAGIAQLSGVIEQDADGPAIVWRGSLVMSDGTRRGLLAQQSAAPTPEQLVAEADDKKPAVDPARRALFAVNYPLGGYGISGAPEQPAAVLFQNATVWTSGGAGMLPKGSVLVQSGKITAVGTELQIPEGTVIIDLAGKHLSPGIIDCHSHICTDGGINEMGQTITAEVRIGDFIDSNDIRMYRQLAGGTTCANILHGSANAIGGQNQVIKFRWGALPEELKFADAPAGIKFALGENVKQSNWGDRYTNRYPQTRLGTEQIIRDAFRAALEYQAAWKTWQADPTGLPPRRDLELEALQEVLAGMRKIHCHSYRQDEILAFLRTCEEFNVRVATLQHVLEGYKVADAIARHGAGGSSFTDWWAYKFEVYDAIPHNASLMHEAGVLMSFNSDDAELGRHLNLEAAKAIKYGTLSPEAALLFVTLNPARQLGIEARVGSIEVGKDADLAVWNAAPLSSYARCEQTWIDGRKYFDRTADAAAQVETRRMRTALVQRILSSGEPMEGLDEVPKDPWPREDIFCHHGHDDGHDHHQAGE